jgi:hypothetical protein
MHLGAGRIALDSGLPLRSQISVTIRHVLRLIFTVILHNRLFLQIYRRSQQTISSKVQSKGFIQGAPVFTKRDGIGGSGPTPSS